MTENHKRFAIIAITVILAILILLYSRKGAAGAAAGSDYSLPAVTGVNLGPAYSGGGPTTYVIPGLNLSGPNLNMIGACCSDCMSGPQVQAVRTPEIVFNQASPGPTVFNYFTQASPYAWSSIG